MQNLALFKIVAPNDGTQKMVVLGAFRILTVPKMLSLVSLIVITERKCGRIKKKRRLFVFHFNGTLFFRSATIQDVMPRIKYNLSPPLAALIS